MITIGFINLNWFEISSMVETIGKTTLITDYSYRLSIVHKFIGAN